jgi:hypothetical protein
MAAGPIGDPEPPEEIGAEAQVDLQAGGRKPLLPHPERSVLLREDARCPRLQTAASLLRRQQQISEIGPQPKAGAPASGSAEELVRREVLPASAGECPAIRLLNPVTRTESSRKKVKLENRSNRYRTAWAASR